MKKLIITLSLFITSIALVACSSSDNLQKPSPLVDFTPQIKVSKVWSHSTGGSGDDYLNLHIAAANNTIYTVSYKGKVFAFNAQNGDEVWEKNIDAKITSGISVKHNIAIIGTADGSIVALNANNGEELWETSIGNQVLGTAAIGRYVSVVKTVADMVIALNNSTGKVLWRYNGSAPTLILRGGSAPVINGSSVIVGFADGKVVKLSLSKGIPEWEQAIAMPQGSFPIQRMIDIDATPQIVDSVIFATTYQGNLAALEASNGQVIWSHKMSSYTGIAVRGNKLFVTDAKGHVWCLQQDDGGVLWRQKQLEARILSAPAAFNNTVVVGDGQGYIHWLSQSNGSFMAREHIGSSAIRTAPVVYNNKVYILNVDGKLAAFQIVS